MACDHFGDADQDEITKLEGKVRRPHLYQCNASRYREQFTVTVCRGFGANSRPQSSRKCFSCCQSSRTGREPLVSGICCVQTRQDLALVGTVAGPQRQGCHDAGMVGRPQAEALAISR